jgi:hypothetical protein
MKIRPIFEVKILVSINPFLLKDLGMKTAHYGIAFPQSSVSVQLGSGVGRREAEEIKEANMLETILVVLVIAWALGLFAFHAGSLIHVLLVIALVVLVVRLLQGKKIL